MPHTASATRATLTFGVLMSLAFLVAGRVMQSDFARKNEPWKVAWEIVGFGMFGGLLGARLHQAVYHWSAFVAAPFDFVSGRSGLVWYGGVLGGVVATVWPIRRAAVSYASALDTGALDLTIGLAIGRLGCHLSGDGDWGIPTALPWGVAYPDGTAVWPYPPGIYVHPAPLYEMVALLTIFVLLLHLRRHVVPTGGLFAIYFLLTGVTRVLVEFVRTNPPIFLNLTEAQWTSIALGGGAAVWLGSHPDVLRQIRTAGANRDDSPRPRRAVSVPLPLERSTNPARHQDPSAVHLQTKRFSWNRPMRRTLERAA
jgi:phosphatidylglycerol---prolipoprotein diacylglyceryl transferase